MSGYGAQWYDDEVWYKQNIARVAAENALELRQRLKEKFNVPDEFMDLATQIWQDGKED